MRRMSPLVCVFSVAFGILVYAADPPKISPDEVSAYVNKRVTVCGTVVETQFRLSPREGGKQYFLHFAHQQGTSPVAVVIIGNDLAAGGVFHDIDKRAAQKRVCATGYPKSTGAEFQLRVDAPPQIKIVDAEAQE